MLSFQSKFLLIALCLVVSLPSIQSQTKWQAIWYKTYTPITATVTDDYHNIGSWFFLSEAKMNEAILPPLAVTNWQTVIKRDDLLTFDTERIITYENVSSKSRYRYFFPALATSKHVNSKTYVMWDLVVECTTCILNYKIKYFSCDTTAATFYAALPNTTDKRSYRKGTDDFVYALSGTTKFGADDTKIIAALTTYVADCSTTCTP